MNSPAGSNSDPLFDVESVTRQIGEEGLEAVWQEVREQWALEMAAMITEQEMIRSHSDRNPCRINRKLDMFPGMHMHELFSNFLQVAHGWDPNWTKDPDKVRWVKKKYPVVVPNVEKPMDRVGWTRGLERGAAGIILTDARGNAQ